MNERRLSDGFRRGLSALDLDAVAATYPRGPLKPEYPAHCKIRRASGAGTFRLFKTQVFLSHALADDDIALEEVDDGLWNALFYNSLIGRYDQRSGLITGADFRHSKG